MDNHDDVFQPSTSPPLTRTLEICAVWGMEYITRQLLNLPNGFHFWKLDCTWYLEDVVWWINALVDSCVGTLQCVYLEPRYLGEFYPFGSLEPARNLDGFYIREVTGGSN